MGDLVSRAHKGIDDMLSGVYDSGRAGRLFAQYAYAARGSLGAIFTLPSAVGMMGDRGNLERKIFEIEGRKKSSRETTKAEEAALWAGGITGLAAGGGTLASSAYMFSQGIRGWWAPIVVAGLTNVWSGIRERRKYLELRQVYDDLTGEEWNGGIIQGLRELWDEAGVAYEQLRERCLEGPEYLGKTFSLADNSLRVFVGWHVAPHAAIKALRTVFDDRIMSDDRIPDRSYFPGISSLKEDHSVYASRLGSGFFFGTLGVYVLDKLRDGELDGGFLDEFVLATNAASLLYELHKERQTVAVLAGDLRSRIRNDLHEWYWDLNTPREKERLHVEYKTYAFKDPKDESEFSLGLIQLAERKCGEESVRFSASRGGNSQHHFLPETLHMFLSGEQEGIERVVDALEEEYGLPHIFHRPHTPLNRAMRSIPFIGRRIREHTTPKIYLSMRQRYSDANPWKMGGIDITYT